MTITLADIIKVWDGKAKQDKTKIRDNFNKYFDFISSQSLYARFTDLSTGFPRTKTTDKQKKWLIKALRVKENQPKKI